MTRILQHSGGRAFVLFTSYVQMRQVIDRRRSDGIQYPTLMQGTGPRVRCSTSSATPRIAFYSPHLRSGRVSTCRASN